VRRVVAVCVAVLALSACGGVANQVATDRAQARADLDRWAAVVAKVGDAFAPVEDLTRVVGGFSGPRAGEQKLAVIGGALRARAPLAAGPSTGTIRWVDRSTLATPLLSAAAALAAVPRQAPCPTGCVPVEVTAARLLTMTVNTTRGAAEVPTWRFTLAGTSVELLQAAVPASRVTALTSPYGPDPTRSAHLAADGRTLIVSFMGAPLSRSHQCGADYTAEVVESPTAVVPIVVEHPHGGIGSCASSGAVRTATVLLAAPLGSRAVLDLRSGLPMAVTRDPG
jgi:hypothetical protein